MPGARRDHCGIEVRRQLCVTRIQIRIIEVTFQHALLQAIRHSERGPLECEPIECNEAILTVGQCLSSDNWMISAGFFFALDLKKRVLTEP